MRRSRTPASRAMRGSSRPSRSTSPASTTIAPSSKRTDSTSPAPTSSRPSPRPSSVRRRMLRGRSAIRSRMAVGGAAGHQVAVHQHQHPRRHALHLVQHVRGDQHRAALLAEAHDQVDDVAPLGGVEAVERLVEQQQLRVVGEGLGQLHALAHAVREAPQLAVGGVGEGDHLERAARRGLVVADAAQAGAQRHHRPRGEEGPEGVAVVRDADAGVGGLVAREVGAEHPHRPGAGLGEPRAQLQAPWTCRRRCGPAGR